MTETAHNPIHETDEALMLQDEIKFWKRVQPHHVQRALELVRTRPESAECRLDVGVYGDCKFGACPLKLVAEVFGLSSVVGLEADNLLGEDYVSAYINVYDTHDVHVPMLNGPSHYDQMKRVAEGTADGAAARYARDQGIIG